MALAGSTTPTIRRLVPTHPRASPWCANVCNTWRVSPLRTLERAPSDRRPSNRARWRTSDRWRDAVAVGACLPLTWLRQGPPPAPYLLASAHRYVDHRRPEILGAMMAA